MSYLKFLQFALANLGTVKLLLQKIQEIADIIKSVDFGSLGEGVTDNSGVLSITESLTVDGGGEESALEAEVQSLLLPESSEPQAEAFSLGDGSKLRELFKFLTTYGPMLVALFGKK